MGRELKRVPIDFNAPINKIWEGYYLSDKTIKKYKFPVTSCRDCESKNKDREDFCLEQKTPYCIFYNNKWRSLWYYEPPVGDGYQLWNTTTEGEPMTPVFKSAEELAEYCESNCSPFADYRWTKEEWLSMIISCM